jgi:GH24 family phage-related lysozyme (muramidase)
MGDIHNSASLREFIHRNEGNSVYTFMYCDGRGEVTVGVGNLLPTFNAAITLHHRFRFHHHENERPTGVAQPAEVQADWERVRAGGRLARFADRRQIASLRLSRRHCLLLLRSRINDMVDAMYSFFPWAQELPDEIQMAIIDARYNPKGINPFQEAPLLWSALQSNPRNLEAALAAFTQYWSGGNEVYQRRQQRRLTLFRQGIDRLRGVSNATWALDKSPAEL